MDTQDIRKIVGKRIRFLREQLKLSQEELAFRSGLHRTYIGGIERGERNPTVSTLSKIAKAMDIKIHDIFNNI